MRPRSTAEALALLDRAEGVEGPPVREEPALPATDGPVLRVAPVNEAELETIACVRAALRFPSSKLGGY